MIEQPNLPELIDQSFLTHHIARRSTSIRTQPHQLAQTLTRLHLTPLHFSFQIFSFYP